MSSFFQNVISLEIYLLDRSDIMLYNCSSFPFECMQRLEELTMATGNIAFLLDKDLAELVKTRLKRFRLNVSSTSTCHRLDQDMAYLNELADCACVKRVDIDIEIMQPHFLNVYQELFSEEATTDSLPVLVINEHIRAIFSSTRPEKIHSIRLASRLTGKWIVIKNIDILHLNDYGRLVRLDLCMVHIHSNESICRQIGELRCKDKIYCIYTG